MPNIKRVRKLLESGKEEVQALLVSLGALVSQGEEKAGDAGFFKSPLLEGPSPSSWVLKDVCEPRGQQHSSLSAAFVKLEFTLFCY